jgi:dTDP-4-amino-4,6-dideoxygalactose transaminase
MSAHRLRTRIPFNRPTLAGGELEYVTEAIESSQLSGDGPMARHCEELLSAELDGASVLLTPSCTQALEMAALLLEIQPGDEVICPAFTHPSSVNAFVMRGAIPRFCDIRPDTLNLDEGQVEERVGERTAAIVCTHYAGVACELDELLAIAERHGSELVEDNAHGLFGSYRDRPLGTAGRFAALSFHETKNLTSGEGGALVLNRAEDVARAEVIRDKGTNRAAYFRGEVDAYEWTDLGSSYLPSELQAAFLRGQLEGAEEIQSSRRRIWDRYAAELSEWAEDHDVSLPAVPGDRRHPAHIFHLRMHGRQERDALIDHLSLREILAVFHYLPLHRSAAGRRLDPGCGALPVTEATAEGLVRLPVFAGLSDDEQSRVIEAVTEFSP